MKKLRKEDKGLCRLTGFYKKKKAFQFRPRQWCGSIFGGFIENIAAGRDRGKLVQSGCRFTEGFVETLRRTMRLADPIKGMYVTTVKKQIQKLLIGSSLPDVLTFLLLWKEKNKKRHIIGIFTRDHHAGGSGAARGQKLGKGIFVQCFLKVYCN